MSDAEFAGRVEGLRLRQPSQVEWMFSTFRGDVERCFGRRPAEDRADLVQDVFTTALTRLHTFQGDREASLRAWLRSIAFHRWHHRWEADQVRARHAGPALEALLIACPNHASFGDPHSDPCAVVCEAALIRSALTRLTPGQARVLHAHVIEGRTTAEIAASWGVPRERVRGLYKRALAKLRADGSSTYLRPAA
ncbi:MAG: RNA polymerase sigma factor [Candidatus Dormibacteria bacterium]